MSINRWRSFVYQGWVTHKGTMRVHSASVSSSLCRILGIKQKGGKQLEENSFQSREKAFICHGPGSGCHATYLSSWLLTLEANRPTLSHTPSFAWPTLRTTGSSFHSISLPSVLDSSSASSFWPWQVNCWYKIIHFYTPQPYFSGNLIALFCSAIRFVDACDRSTVIRQQSDVSVFIGHVKRLKDKQSCSQFEAVYVQHCLFGCPETSSSSTITTPPPPSCFEASVLITTEGLITLTG